ncbi:MAG: ABC transporter permease [Acidimicrobiales bacterium]|nr:ABC transporter permease [Acidimicrobiales bacterium]
MTAIDPTTTVSADDPTAERPTATDLFLRLPRWARGLVYAVVPILVLAIAREMTGADQLTSANTVSSALKLSMPIALAGLGGLWSERAGIVNIGLEGMMVLGTWFGAYGAIAYGPWTGVLMGVLGGALGGLLHAVATVTFGVDHIISGVAINLLAVGLTDFLTTTTTSWGNATKESPPIPSNVVDLDLIPFLKGPLQDLSNQNRFFLSDVARILLGLTTGVSILIVIGLAMFAVTGYVLWRTRFGLRLRSVGEDPDAADSLGVRVYSLKYAATIMSGALSGLGGVLLVYLFAEKFQSQQTNGRGFIGLAAMIFGNWRPGGLIAGAGLFGFMDSMQSQVNETAHALLVVTALLFVLVALRLALRSQWRSAAILVVLAIGSYVWYQNTDELPVEFIPYFPHFTTLLVLVFASQRLRMPSADGKIWRRSG